MRARLDLGAIDDALREVQATWPRIDDELERLGIGRKDPFTTRLRGNMLSAYAYVDDLVARKVEPFAGPAAAVEEPLLALNNLVHYGTDRALWAEYASAIAATAEMVNERAGPIAAWYRKHAAAGDHPYKLAAETFVAVLGQPQLFIEGNHRTGALIASWINLAAGRAPFVLSAANALAFFAPSEEIKRFADRSTWRGRARLPKYRKAFRRFWEQHVDRRYLLGTSDDREDDREDDAAGSGA